MTKKSSLAASLATAAGKRIATQNPILTNVKNDEQIDNNKNTTVLIAAHFSPDVRRVLKFLEAETGKNLKQLLGEAINDLAAKYGKPEPYDEEA